jgi:hypothetical protein
MKIETFEKRFGKESIPLLKGLIYAMLQGKNKKTYNVSIDKKGLPIAKVIVIKKSSN